MQKGMVPYPGRADEDRENVMERNMTEGGISKQIVGFAIPIILGNIFQQLYNTADAVIVGRMIGKDAFAAVSVANPIMSVVLFFIVGLTMGVGVLLSQKFGAENRKGFRVQFSTGLIAGIVFTLVMTVLCIPLSGLMLKAAQTPAEIYDVTKSYLQVIFAGMIFSFLYNYYASALRAIGDSRTAFLYLVVSSILNIILDIVFVTQTPLGVLGAAAATIISQAVSFVLCLFYVRKKVPMLVLGKGSWIFERRILKETVIFSWAAALQQTVLYFGRLLIQGTVNAHGTDMITGYNAAIRIESFTMAFIDGTAAALATFAGQNVGAGKLKRLRQGLFRTLWMNGLYVLVSGVLMVVFSKQLITLFVDRSNTEVLRVGTTYLKVMAANYLFCSILSATQGFFRGVGKVKITMIATMVQMVVRCLLALILVPHLEIWGVCISVITGWLVVSSMNGIEVIKWLNRDGKKDIIGEVRQKR